MMRPRAVTALLLLAVLVAACTSHRDGSEESATADLARSVEVGGRNVYLTCHGLAAAGAPTVVLISGYHDSSDVWTQADALDLLTPAVGPPVFPALAVSHRVCAYDRPGTLRYLEGTPLTDRSTPFPGLSADELNRLYERAQDAIVALAPATPHVFATGSDHCIQCSQPDLVVQATELVERRAAARH